MQGLNQAGEPVLTLHLLVQFYVEKLNSVRSVNQPRFNNNLQSAVAFKVDRIVTNLSDTWVAGWADISIHDPALGFNGPSPNLLIKPDKNSGCCSVNGLQTFYGRRR